MASVNKVILLGNLGRDPELRYTSNGTPVATFPLATNRVYTDKNGERQEVTTWHRVVAWAKLGEICGQYLKKGRQVYIEGELVTRSFVGQDGQTRWVTEVVARNMQMLGSPNGNGRAESESTGDTESPPAFVSDLPPDGFEEEDDVPF